MTALRTFVKRLTRRNLLIGIGILIVAGFLILSRQSKDALESVVVARSTITETVVVTGKTKPAEDVSLGFERAGKVTNVNVRVGDQVTPGQALVSLDASELNAQLAQAQATVDSQQAKLDELKRGARPEDIDVKRAELKKAEQDLRNYFTSIPDLLQDAYTKSDDAVRKQTNGIFSGDEEINPQLTFSTTDSQIDTDIRNQRVIAGQELTKWKKELGTLGALSSDSQLETALSSGIIRLTLVRSFLNRTMDALTIQNTLSSATASTYKANITTGRTNVNTTFTALNSQLQDITSQALTVARIENELQLKLAGTVAEQVRAQEALVRQAEAEVALIHAQLGKTILHAPISGVVTTQEATAGEIVAAYTTLVTIISDTNLEIEAHIPEVDIGRISVGNPVRITVDAFPEDAFNGRVTHIDPAETIIDGVVNFTVTIHLDTDDGRMKSGLTANLDIETQKKEGVIVIPQYTIIENDQGTFVRVLHGDATTDVPVVLGIRSQEGTVEIVSGIEEGASVVNVGLRTEAR